MHDQRGLGNVRLGPHNHTKGWGAIRGTKRWFVICYNKRNKFTICMGDGVEDRFMVVHDKAKGFTRFDDT
jgi:hypothetical protein